jgi:hypothetical protein
MCDPPKSPYGPSSSKVWTRLIYVFVKTILYKFYTAKILVHDATLYGNESADKFYCKNCTDMWLKPEVAL